MNIWYWNIIFQLCLLSYVFFPSSSLLFPKNSNNFFCKSTKKAWIKDFISFSPKNLTKYRFRFQQLLNRKEMKIHTRRRRSECIYIALILSSYIYMIYVKWKYSVRELSFLSPNVLLILIQNSLPSFSLYLSNKNRTKIERKKFWTSIWSKNKTGKNAISATCLP